jgi:hypothetical protein
MTRAEDDLQLIVPQRFFTHGQNAQGDRHVYGPDGLIDIKPTGRPSKLSDEQKEAACRDRPQTFHSM